MTYQWRVTFEKRTELCYASDLQGAVDTASRRVREEDGKLKTVELYSHGEQPPWGLVYAAPPSPFDDFGKAQGE